MARKPPTCPTHGVALLCPACVGGQGGRATGGRKAISSRENAKKAADARRGRPRCPGCLKSATMIDGHWWCRHCGGQVIPATVPRVGPKSRA